ncbi:MAG: DNA-binding protein [Candidatus Ancaeobacter aquaticus]|nr:DNA-binding protein [Candidatus Ancaeobacter aquaticus]
MQADVGKLGKIVVAKFEHGEDFIGGLETLSKKHKIKTGLVFFLGALKGADIVTGPQKAVIPPEPNWNTFNDGREVFGFGTIFYEKGKPKLHLHMGAGKKSKTLVGCIRKNAKIYLVIEAFMLEIKGINARKELDPKTGLIMLKILSAK